MPWVRVDDGFYDHPKFVKAGPAATGLWLSMLAYSNRNLTNGRIGIQIAIKLWRYLGQIRVRALAKRLVECGLIQEVGSDYQICNYLLYQPSKEEVMAKREKTKRRVLEWRAERRNSVTRPPVTHAVTHAVTLPPTQEDSNGAGAPVGVTEDPKKEKRRIKTYKSFSKPSLEEVRAYCLERKNQVFPDQWLDHYQSNGWMVGRNPMRDWKAAVRTWERQRGYEKPRENGFTRSKGAVLMELGKRMKEGGDVEK